MHSLKLGALVCAALASLLFAVPEAAAQPRVTEKTRYYAISGRSAAALLGEMNRRGPRQGFLKKAIAQTRYKTKFRGEMVYEGGVCRVVDGGVQLDITYVYPQPRAVRGDLARRWRAFEADTVRHEEHHGRMARAMAAELDSHIRGFAMKDRRNCRRADARMRREADRIYKRYSAQQRAFDEREHRAGGAVEKSILKLLGNERRG